MTNKYFLGICLVFFVFGNIKAQWGDKEKRGTVDLSNVTIQPFHSGKFDFGISSRDVKNKFSLHSIAGEALRLGGGVEVKVLLQTDRGSLWIEGRIDQNTARNLDKTAQRNLFVKHALVKSGVSSIDDIQEIAYRREGAIDHYKLQLQHQGIPVWTNQLSLHLDEQQFQLMGNIQNLSYEEKQVLLDEDQAMGVASARLADEGIHIIDDQKKDKLSFILQDDHRELVWYEYEGHFLLAWHVSVHPNLMTRWEYFIDANDGSILDKYESLCKVHHLPPDSFFDGQSVGSGLDLDGEMQTIQTYQIGNVHTLIDVTRSDMFDPRGSIPGNPIGTIITLDAINTFPGSDDFNYQDLVSNSTTWNNPDAVSAHVNAAKAYEYFLQFFNRISINGQGGNIISLINVADENGERMDNAFWNGKAIFYGRGNQAFSSPLARGLDVAAHELGHGVIETSANLLYQGESGALNESFADVFGVLVENEDWLIGEDIVNKSVFPVALRNMADPHNGGTGLNDNGWQPAHYDERFSGRQDNGGVHINSGIPNRAFYLFATHMDVGVEKAEQVYYSVLTNYLTRSSQFVDMRVAVISAARSLYGDQVAAAAGQAFDQVGILGDQTGDYTEDVEVNPGQDFILYTSFEDGLLHLIDAQGNSLTGNDPLSEVPPHNPPSITDDGSLIMYVAEDRTIRYIQFNWGAGTYAEDIFDDNPIWQNVAVSKDGTKVAAILDAVNDSIYVFSLEQGNFQIYELSNPTTANGEINTSDVRFADALEWDHTGELVMYDAFNSLSKLESPQSFDYWDINFIRVWDAEADDYGDGNIVKLFTGLPEQISIANPTFSKNSPYIIAFDYLDESIGPDALKVLGLNLETYDLGTIYENTTTPGYPSFSRSDERIIFNAKGETQSGIIDVLGIIDLADDKINSQGNASVFFQNAVWGEWFSNGERTLVNILEGDQETGELTYYPNPTESELFLEADWLANPGDLQIDVISIDGKLVSKNRFGGN
ncbi:MAG: M4 family metallopeptidase, partial [Saprospiraceae bacterium]|nr:M4 family metallopeptidase [Saprospiraceae bacterium]